ncbi:MAG: AAA family ATPase [Blautia sp.]|nr:AAA family ATPase [Blautia sp.]
MNIKEAKEEIKHTLLAYHRKAADGSYCYPLVRQRPILLIGPPGIGKTAVMEQAAEECGVGLVSYTMTHHTRQSAIGLPRIVTKSYDGRELTVTEYTLSEIITSVYDCMERTGKREGILFIDEINCVSETLAPTMLQFLQNKCFGSHKVPEGWMIAAAGNPPEYNKSVREFDIVTLDRVRKIEIRADCDVWLEYAWKQRIHGAILSYVDLKRDHFYLVNNTADGKFFVTARGWEDLSQILKSYEELDISVTEDLIVQYLQEPETAADFAGYYHLYRKYGTDYGIAAILSGEVSAGDSCPKVSVSAEDPCSKTGMSEGDSCPGTGMSAEDYRQKTDMAKHAGFSERFMIIGLFLDFINLLLEDYGRTDRRTVLLHETLKYFQKFLEKEDDIRCLDGFIKERKESLKVKRDMELISSTAEEDERAVIRCLQEYDLMLQERHISDKQEGWEQIRTFFSEKPEILNQKKKAVQTALQQAFAFTAECFGEEKEMILLLTGLTRNARAMEFIRKNGCEAYTAYSAELLNQWSEKELQEACRTLLSETQN